MLKFGLKDPSKMNLKCGMMWHLARNYSLYAELFKRKRGSDEIKGKNLTRAVDISKECGADGVGGKI